MSMHPSLRRLAEQIGILPSYIDQFGHRRWTSDRARVDLLAAMGIDAGSEAAAGERLAERRAAAAAEVLAPTRVADVRAAGRLVANLPPRVRAWAVDVDCEDGTTRRATGLLRRGGRASIQVPSLPLGYHRVRLTLTIDGGAERVAEQRLIVAPAHCPTPRQRLGGQRVYGLLANLYTVRSADNWGVGDLSDLARLAEWGAGVGASFVGINPLHALDNRGNEISPYSPITRLYRNILYLDVTAVPEWTDLPSAVRRGVASEAALARLRDADRVDYGAVRALKIPAAAALHQQFVERHRGRDTARGRAYADYLVREGEALTDFATFLALQEHFETQGAQHWRRWPAAYRDPRAAAVREFRAAHREVIDRHCYLQFELDRQLAGAAERAAAAGMRVGVYQDLALGSSRVGSDPWSFPGLFLDRIDIGAPPDAYSRTGQNWGLPPMDPRALAAQGYEYWVRLLRGALRHAGALRIDHVMGLFRQYWIPSGATGAHGAYVRFPADALLGILALEGQRANALVIGEDLGTVPRGLPKRLARWSILSTRVLYFERTARDGFRPARAYLRRALVGVNTHDMVPLAGYWEGEDLVLRRRVGLLPDDRALGRARAARERERRALLRRLRRDGALPPTGPDPNGAALRAAVHRFLARTPAVLFGASLDDVTGEVTPVNLPGMPISRYPSWSRRMRLPLEALPTDPDVARVLDGLAAGPRGARRRRAGEKHG